MNKYFIAENTVALFEGILDHIATRRNNTPMKVMLDDGAKMPTRAHRTDAGLDLYTRADTVVPAHGCATFDTGVHIELPPNTYGKIESKSGLNVKHNIVSCGGTIDCGYTGSIVVKLYNLGNEDYTFNKGMKIAQLLVAPCMFVEVEQGEIDKNTDRKSRGFGSTGI